MNNGLRIIFGAVLATLSACSGPSNSITRSADGLLILGGKYPTSFNLSEGFGTLVAKGRCIILSVKGVGQFQPVFREGTTRETLERELGDLATPRLVTFGGMDPAFLVNQGLDKSAAVAECPGLPITASGFVAPAPGTGPGLILPP